MKRAPLLLPLLASLAAAVAFAGTAFAQDVPPPARPAPPPVAAPPPADESGDTVLGARIAHGGYGAPVMKLTSLAGDGAILAGGEGGWILGRTLVLGGGGYGTVTDVISPQALQPPTGNAHLGIGYGGFRLGAIFGARRVAHLTLGVLVGGGSATSETRNESFRTTDTFSVIEPDLATEVNLARHVRLGVGGTYRFVGGLDVAGFTAQRLSGPAAMLTLRFGEF